MLLKKFAAKSQGKEPVKFSFNISINSLDDFKKPKTSQGSTYVVHWKRGNKNSGKTEPKAFNEASGKVVWMDTFKFNGTLFREVKNKDQYKKKALNFVLEECSTDSKKKSITIAKAEIDISKYAPVSSDLEHGTHEKTETVLVDLGIKGNPEAKIKVSLNIVARSGIKPGDEAATLMSEYTGADTEIGDDNSEKEDVHTGKETATEPKSIEEKENERSDFEVSNDEKTHDQDDADEKTHDEDHAPASSSSSSAPIASSSANLNASFAVSKEDENKKLREAIVELQKQLKEAKQIKDANKKEKKDLLQKIQKERDDANSRVKSLEKELQTSKIELEHLQSANTNQNNKFFEDQLKYQKEKTELEQKLKNLNKELDDIQQRNFELEDEKDTLVAEKEELIEKIKSVEGNAEVNGDEIKKIKEQLEAKLKEKEEMIAAQENSWTQERREYEVKIEALSTEISTLKNQMEVAEQKKKEDIERELADKSKGESLLAQELALIRTQLVEVETSNADLNAELKSKTEQIADLETQLETSQSSIKSLEQQYTTSQEQIQKIQEEKQSLEEQKSSIESNLSIITQERVELEQERSRLEVLLKEAEQKMQNQETEEYSTVATTAVASASLELFRETILEALFAASEVSVKMKTISYRVTQNRIHEITSSFEDENRENEDDAEEEDDALIDETKLSKFLITYKKLKHSIHALGVEIHELENQLTPKNEKSKAHDDDFSEEEEDVGNGNLRQQLKALQAKYDEAMEKMQLHTQERDRLLRQVVDLKKKAKKKSGSDSENEDQESDDDTAEEVARLANENKKLLKIKEELEERLDEMKEEHTEIVTLLKKNKTSLENEVKRLKESSVKSTSASPKLSPSADAQKIVDLERRIDELSEELEEAQGAIKAKEETIKKLKESINEVSEKMEELVDNLNNQITTWKEKCTDQYDHIQVIEKKLRKATEKNESEKIKSTDITKQLQVFRQEQLEKYVLDSCILLISRPQFVKNLPISLKPIFICILHWRCFDANKNVTFCPNLIHALDYVIDRSVTKVRMEAYWINFLYRLLNLLSTDFNEQVVKNLKEMQEQGDSTFFTNGSNESMKESIEKARDAELPSFVSAADASNSKSPAETADWFIKECCRLIVKAYTHLLRGIFAKMEKLIDKGVVSDLDSSSNPSLNQMKKILDKVLIQLEEAKLEKRVVQHVLEHVAMYVDAYIFNSMMKQPNVNAGKALNIKMNVSTLANWFEDHGVRPSSLEEGAEENNMAQFTLFPYSRQVSDVCVIAQKTLLTDEGMRQIVCPTLTIAQIAHLMANYAPDEIDNKSVSADVLKTLQQIKDSQNEKLKSKVLYVKPAVRVQHYREPKSLAIQNQQPLFDFSKQGSMDTNNNAIKDVQISASLIEKYKEDLKFLNQ